MRRLRTVIAMTGVLALMLGASTAGPQLAMASGQARSTQTSFPAREGAALPPGHAWTVTLVTGDIVQVRTAAAGRPPMVSVQPGPGRRNVIFSKFVSSTGRIEVLPHDVAPLVGRLLDPALFDVTTLILNGDDDAHQPYLPLIVQAANGAGAAAAVNAASPALQQGTVLSSIGAVAAREPRTSAAREGAALAAMASAAVRAGRMTSRVTGGIRYIWLDRTVRAAGGAVSALASGPASRVTAPTAAKSGPLDHNLVQIGVPAAWRAGDTGRGVMVAVLDTGVDATHPDLRGQIAAAKNFSASPGVTDRFGHGTFVAGQVAGTGAAADGQRRGVAFGARLLIGKVLNDDGTGKESAVIAGMQWAATRAKVISMSLGIFMLPGGTDPLSQAVNRLTAADHVLFVVAAGNDGPAAASVESPGLATSALTVGAVDGAGKLAFFSSRGPLPGDYAIKPEITAPGVNITGDRAAGTTMGSPLDARYITASGTSMSTPQVAGAAAILAGLHPGWGPGQLKAALVSAARPVPGADVYQRGGGMLDVAAAVRDTVVSDQAVAGLGTVAFGSTKPVTQVLTWTNTGKSPVTLHLSAVLTDHAGHPAPAGAVGLTAGRVRVPAGRTASVTLSASPRLLDRHPGLYEGQVVARAGGQAARTPIGIYAPAQTYSLTIRATALPGTGRGKMAAEFDVVNVDDPTPLFQTDGAVGAAGTTLQVPAGHYWVSGLVEDLTNPAQARVALTGQPEVTVHKNTTVTLDGAAAVPVTASVTGHPTQMTTVGVHVERSFAGQVYGAGLFFGAASPAPVLFAQPTGTASTGTFHAYTLFRLISPAGAARPYLYDLYHPVGTRIPASLTYTVTPARQATLARVNERFFAVDGNTSRVMHTRFALTPSGFIVTQNESLVGGGSTRTDYLSAGPGIAWPDEVDPPLRLNGQDATGLWVILRPGIPHYAPGSQQTTDWARQPFRPGPYSATRPSLSFCAPLPTTRSRGDIHVELTDLQNLPDGFDCLGGMFPLSEWAKATSRTMRLYRDNHLVGTSRLSAADFTVPEAGASYQLTYTDNTAAALAVSTQTQTTWTFRSAAPRGLGAVRIPLLLVDYHLPLNLDNHPDGSTAQFTVTRVAGTPPARVTGLTLQTSTDNGRTWRPAPVHSLGAGRYTATLPHAAPGQPVSLRVQAADAGGSGIQQTIITAYHG